MSQLRQRIASRLGLGGLLSTSLLLAGCADDPQPNTRDAEPEPGLTGERSPTNPQTLPEPAVYSPVLSVSEAAVVYPIRFTVDGAPPFASVRFDVDTPVRSWTLIAQADADGFAEYETYTAPALRANDWIITRAEVEAEQPIFLDSVETTIESPACNFNAVTSPGGIAVLRDNQQIRACEPLPAAGVCSAFVEFHEWRAFDMIVDNFQDIPPPNFTFAPMCNETSITDACCYVIRVDDPSVVGLPPGGWLGRPFTVGAEVRNPLPTRDPAWADPCGLELAAAVSPRVRRRIARRWAKQATDEHASVASFARLTLELLQLGAPPELVALATRAQADEIQHARSAFAVASHFAGAPVGPGRIDVRGTLGRQLPEILMGAVLEGCLNETICAAWAADAAANTPDPALGAQLTAIADDEARHAELSWALVQWLLGQAPELAPTVQDAVDRFDLGTRPAADPDADQLAIGGQLSGQREHDLGQSVLRDVIRPAFAELLGRSRQAA